MEKYLDSSLSTEERAIALTDAMTVEEQASQLRYDAPAVKRLGIPAYNWWNEGLHGLARSGIATMFPQAIGLAAMFDTELTKTSAFRNDYWESSIYWIAPLVVWSAVRWVYHGESVRL